MTGKRTLVHVIEGFGTVLASVRDSVHNSVHRQVENCIYDVNATNSVTDVALFVRNPLLAWILNEPT